MKKREAIIRPERLGMVTSALIEAGFLGLTYYEASGRGRRKGEKQMWRGREYNVNFWPKIFLIIVVSDEEVDKAIETIQEASVTGELGDGIIYTLPVEKIVRIRTGESGKIIS